MRRGISARDGCEIPHNYSKPKWHLKVIFSSKQNACHKQWVVIIQLLIAEYNNARTVCKYSAILYGYLDSWLVTLYWKKPCLTSRLRALRFFSRFAILALWETGRET